MRKLNLKRFGIRRIRKPQIQGGLHSTVPLPCGGYADIGFTFALVKRAGQVLPRGISAHDPAFMRLLRGADEGTWVLYVEYFSDECNGQRYPLLLMDEYPEWAKKPKKAVQDKGESHASHA